MGIVGFAVYKESRVMEPIRQAEESAPLDLGDLLDAGDCAVVTLVAGETRLVAHRAVLSSRSSVFAAMFGHDTLEASSGEVTITDVEGPVLRHLLSYIYSLRTPWLPGEAPQLLAAADKYGVPALKAHCERLVAAQLSVETAAATAVLAIRHCCADLRKAAVRFMKANLVQVMATQGWAEAVCTQPKDVVELSRLLSEPPAETSAPAPADSSAAPTTRPHSGHSRSPTPAAPCATAHHTPPPDDAAISRLRGLSMEEKGRKLRQAAKVGAAAEVGSLLAAGADVGAVDGDRLTALHYAALRGHEGVVRRLLVAGAAVDARNSDQVTPLHMAAYSGHLAVVRLLVEAGADPNATKSHGYTPLHLAVNNVHTEVVAALVDAGASRWARINEGLTPLDIAREAHQQLIDILIQS